MALNPLDYFNAYPNDRNGFIQNFTGNYGSRNAASSMYDRFVNLSRSGGGGLGSGFNLGGGGSGGGGGSSSGSGLGGLNLGGMGGTTSGTLGVISNTLGILNRIVTGTADIAGQIYGSQIGQQGDRGPQAVEKLFDIVRSGGLNPLKILTEGIQTVGGEIIEQLQQEATLRSDINTYTTLTGQLSEDLRADMVESSITAAKYGMNVKDISDFYIQLVENSGKFSLINKKFIDSVLPVTKALGLTTQEMANYISEFEIVGNAASRTIRDISDASTRSVSLGLSAREVTKGMKENIGALNEYGFKNGIKGLERMVQTSREFRMNMQDVLGIAEKVMKPEDAVEMSARLQVLGGAMGDFANPMKLMYDATNNVEGLQESLIGAAKTLVTYNKEQERFEVTGANLRRAREMADAMGIKLGDLNRMAIASAERFQAMQALSASALQMKDSDKEFLSNLSRMENGKMTIMVPESIADKLGVPTEIALDKLDANTAKALLENKKDFEKMSPADMADKQLTATQSMARDMAVVAQYYRVRAAQTIGGIMDSKGVQDEVNKLRDVIKEQRQDKLTSSDSGLKGRITEVINRTNFDNMTPVEMGSKIKDIVQEELSRKKQTIDNTTQQQPQTSNVNVTLTVKSGPNIADSLTRELTKNPTIINEWINEQPPQLAKRSFTNSQ